LNLDYQQLFCKATGRNPFPYQCELATQEDFPDLIKIPTGAGKTNGVTMSWVWRRRFAEESIRNQTPRRLVYCLPMRVLVGQTRENVISSLDRLELLAGTAVWKNPEEKTGLIEYLPESDKPNNEKLNIDWNSGYVNLSST